MVGILAAQERFHAKDNRARVFRLDLGLQRPRFADVVGPGGAIDLHSREDFFRTGGASHEEFNGRESVAGSRIS